MQGRRAPLARQAQQQRRRAAGLRPPGIQAPRKPRSAGRAPAAAPPGSPPSPPRATAACGWPSRRSRQSSGWRRAPSRRASSCCAVCCPTAASAARCCRGRARRSWCASRRRARGPARRRARCWRCATRCRAPTRRRCWQTTPACWCCRRARCAPARASSADSCWSTAAPTLTRSHRRPRCCWSQASWRACSQRSPASWAAAARPASCCSARRTSRTAARRPARPRARAGAAAMRRGCGTRLRAAETGWSAAAAWGVARGYDVTCARNPCACVCAAMEGSGTAVSTGIPVNRIFSAVAISFLPPDSCSVNCPPFKDIQPVLQNVIGYTRRVSTLKPKRAAATGSRGERGSWGWALQQPRCRASRRAAGAGRDRCGRATREGGGRGGLARLGRPRGARRGARAGPGPAGPLR
ncbi:MAG: hypothetical protein J3K34DRAFT_111370 [Monoraphidium minutum]|nr:MAG: hypothetical protein J3K34DRAFT_111370 [Monoraphidium minutum]